MRLETQGDSKKCSDSSSLVRLMSVSYQNFSGDETIINFKVWRSPCLQLQFGLNTIQVD